MEGLRKGTTFDRAQKSRLRSFLGWRKKGDSPRRSCLAWDSPHFCSVAEHGREISMVVVGGDDAPSAHRCGEGLKDRAISA